MPDMPNPTNRTNPTETIASSALSPDCTRTQGELVAYLDGELLPAQAALVEAHLAVCPNCTARRDELQATLALVDAFTVDREVNVADAVLQYIAQETLEPLPATPRLVVPPAPPLTEMEQLLAGMQAIQDELSALRSEVADLRRQLATARGHCDFLSPKPAAPRLFPFAAPANLSERG